MNAHAVSRPQADGPEGVPGPIAAVWALLLLLIACHLVIPVLLLVDHGSVEDGIRNANPGFSAGEVHTTLLATLVAGTVFHLVLVVLYTWLQGRLGTGRPRVRRVLTIGMVMATVGSVVSYSSSPLFRDVIPVMDAVQIAIIALTWIPASSRAWFSGERRTAA